MPVQKKDYLKLLAFTQQQARYFAARHKWIPADYVDDLAQYALADLLAYNEGLLYWSDSRKALLARCCKQSFVRFVTKYVVKLWKLDGYIYYMELREAITEIERSRTRVDLFIDAACRYLIILEDDDKCMVCALINLLNNAAGYYEDARLTPTRRGSFNRQSAPRLSSVAAYLGYGARNESLRLQNHARVIRQMMRA